MVQISVLQEAAAAHEVSLPVTLGFAAMLVGLILCLALEEKLHAKKSLIVGLFGVVSLFLGAVFLPPILLVVASWAGYFAGWLVWVLLGREVGG